MYSLRRWWDRHRGYVVLAGLALGVGVFLQQTNGGLVYEIYRLLARPFQPPLWSEAVLQDAKLQEYQQRLEELENQNQQLRDLLDFKGDQKQQGLAAPPIGRSADHWWQQVILGRGKSDGVSNGDIVVAPGGVVGRIFEVSPNTSRVLLLSDPSSRVGATISRSRFMGYARGTSANRAVMEFFDKVPDVRRGDVVVTSSFSCFFPAGLPIGRVESVDLSKSPAPEAVINLSAPINSLEWAIIYQNHQTASGSSCNDRGDRSAGETNP